MICEKSRKKWGLSVEGNFTSDEANRKWFKKEAGVCWEFYLVNSKIQTIWAKTEPKLIVGLKETDR
jgi:hypothetical protein